MTRDTGKTSKDRRTTRDKDGKGFLSDSTRSDDDADEKEGWWISFCLGTEIAKCSVTCSCLRSSREGCSPDWHQTELKGREREGNGGGEGDRIRGQEGIQVCIKRRGIRGYEEGRERQTHSHRGRKKGSDDEKSWWLCCLYLHFAFSFPLLPSFTFNAEIEEAEDEEAKKEEAEGLVFILIFGL